MSREAMLRIRVTDEEQALFQTAADAAGMTVSAWVRMVSVKDARKVLRLTPEIKRRQAKKDTRDG